MTPRNTSLHNCNWYLTTWKSAASVGPHHTCPVAFWLLSAFEQLQGPHHQRHIRCLSGVWSGTTLRRASVQLSKPSDATHSARPMGQPGRSRRLPQPGQLTIGDDLLGYHNNNITVFHACFLSIHVKGVIFSRECYSWYTLPSLDYAVWCATINVIACIARFVPLWSLLSARSSTTPVNAVNMLIISTTALPPSCWPFCLTALPLLERSALHSVDFLLTLCLCCIKISCHKCICYRCTGQPVYMLVKSTI